ncbi:TadE/TadG family type IV pilus assembly protein [Sphingomonas oryzagri]|uniref:TadE/TadG family type IV pilus assembly protein n=1 Tax=Sphingomonas oryzagri TaxID=3042314 RepID=A0ABT6N1Z7_9SPHN|nr:TadE/TadG family type IV pilus assembly protein [Sphingomonas oryzagri]MDH7638406.1 TadE/TadG family type IV pilus assembly protein [Sphingomonas oryzagri]
MVKHQPGSTLLAARKRLSADARGAAIVEMAMTLPILLILLIGIVSYGDWMLTAHSVQQAANDAARASIAGLTSSERAGIAQTTMQTTLRRAGALDPNRATLSVDDDGTTLVVRLRYDASADPLLHLTFVPMPSAQIQRNAAIRLDSL